MDSTKQLKYLELRSKLNQYHYNDSFGIESLELVESLFRDVVAAAGSYKELQEKELRLANDLSLAQSQLFPLRKENSRLVRENHQLHLDSVKKADDFDEYVNKHLQAAKAATDEANELKIKFKAKEDQLLKKEKELSRVRDAYESLLSSSKNTHGVKRTINVSYPIQKAKDSLDLDEKILGNAGDADIVANLRQKLLEAETTIKELESSKLKLTASLASRDEEFDRLSKLASGTQALFQQSGESSIIRSDQAAANLANKRLIDQLNSQIDFLNEQLALREDQISKTNDSTLEFETLKISHKKLSEDLDQAKQLNSSLTGQVRALEKKLIELDQVIDPEGDVTVDALVGLSEAKSPFKNTETFLTDDSLEKPEPKTIPGSRTKPSDKKTISNSRKVSTAPVVPRSLANRNSNTSAAKLQPDTNALVSRLSSERGALSEEISNLNTRLSGLQVGESVLKERLKRSDEKIKALKSELDIANQQLSSAQRQLTTKDFELSRLTEDFKDLNDSYNSLMNRYLDEESRKASNESKTTAIERSLNDTNRDRELLQEVIENLKADLRLAKSERQATLLEKEKMELGWSRLEADLENHRSALESTTTDLRRIRELNVEATVRIEEMESELDSVNKLLAMSESSHKETKAILETKIKEVLEATNTISKLKSSLGGLEIIDGLRNDAKTLRDQCSRLNEDKHRLQNEIDSLAMQLSATEAAEENRRAQENILLRSQSDLQQEMIAKDRKIEDLTLQLSQLRDTTGKLDRDLKIQIQSYNALKASLQERGELVSQKSDDVKQLQSEINLLRSRNADIAQTNESLNEQSTGLAASLSRAQERLSKYESENGQLQEKVLQLQRESDSHRIDYEALKRHYDSLDRRQNATQDDILGIREEKESLLEEVSRLRALIITMESASKHQNGKISQLMSSLDDEIENGNEISKLNQQLNEKIKALTSEKAILSESLRSLDEERDSLQLEFDEKLDELNRQERLRLQAEQQSLQLRQIVESFERRIEELNEDVATSRRHHASFEARINSLVEENLELKRRLSSKSKEVGNAAQDLNLMTQENQALTSELATAVSESDELRRRMSEIVSINSQLEQSKRGLEIERDDLLATYRGVLIEKNKLEQDITALGTLKHKVGLNAQQAQNQLAEVKGVVNAYQETEQKWLSERTALHHQIDKMSADIVQWERKVEAVEADNRRLIQDTYALRQTNSMLNDRMQLLLKRVQELSDANKVITTRLVSLERERDALNSLLNSERQKSLDMSKLVENARSQLAGKERELGRLRGEIFGKPSTVNASKPSVLSSTTAAQLPSSPSSSGSEQYAQVASKLNKGAVSDLSSLDRDMISSLGLSAVDDSDDETN